MWQKREHSHLESSVQLQGGREREGEGVSGVTQDRKLISEQRLDFDL